MQRISLYEATKIIHYQWQCIDIVIQKRKPELGADVWFSGFGK